MPKFSVLMANYNKADYISDAIESVLNQSFRDFELLIIDDGSTDNSLEKITQYILDSRIKLIKNKINKGVIYCQRKLIELAESEILGILDSDDTLEKDALQIVYDFYQSNNQYGFVYTSINLCDEKMNIIGRGSNCRMPDKETVLRFDRVGAFRTFKKADYLKTSGYDERILYAEDADLVMKMEEVARFYYIDKPLYNYRQLSNSQFHSVEKRNIYITSHCLAALNAYLRRRGTLIPNLNSREISDRLYESIPFALKSKNWRIAFLFFLKALSFDPKNILGFLKLFWRLIKFPSCKLLLFIKNHTK